MEQSKIVQVKNPRTGRYIKVDRENALILEHKDTEGAWEGIEIVSNRE